MMKVRARIEQRRYSRWLSRKFHEVTGKHWNRITDAEKGNFVWWYYSEREKGIPYEEPKEPA